MNLESPQIESECLPSPTRRNWVWFSFQFLMRLVFVVWLRYRARGVEKIPHSGGCLFLINHQSYLDPLLVGLPLHRPVSYLARDSLFPVPVIGWILRKTYVMPISRESASTTSIRAAVRRLKHGFLLGIFPEGTRSKDGSVGELKPGFITFVRRAKSPVFPVGIAGAHKAMPRNSWFMKPYKVAVVFGDPLLPEDVERLSRRGQEEKFLAFVRHRIAECQQEAETWRRRSWLL